MLETIIQASQLIDWIERRARARSRYTAVYRLQASVREQHFNYGVTCIEPGGVNVSLAYNNNNTTVESCKGIRKIFSHVKAFSLLSSNMGTQALRCLRAWTNRCLLFIKKYCIMLKV